MKYVYALPFLLLFALIPLSIQAQMFEDFEDGTKAGYAPAAVTLSSGSWFFDDALIGTLEGDKKNGTRSARIRDGHIRMNFDHPDGMSELSFYAANFGNDSGGSVQPRYSTNGGSSWEDLGDSITLTGTLTQYTVSASIQGNVRVRFDKSSGNRINIEDVLISDFIDSTEEPSLSVRINDVPVGNGGSFNFGTTTGSATAVLRLQNTGLEDLVIESSDISGDAFSVDGDLAITLEHMDVQTFTLSFNLPDPGSADGSITINSNDPENGAFTINLSGETLDLNEPMPIAEARQLPQGTMVTVAGHITVTNQFAGPVYFQDDTGGMAWYNDELMRQAWLIDAQLGDSLVVTGEIGAFNNLLQIVNDQSHEVFPESNRQIVPQEITLSDLNTGEFESQLIRISNVEFASSGIFSGGTNYDISDETGSGQLRVDNFTNIGGTSIPNAPAEITGVAGRFMNTRQILPRFTDDIVVLFGPVITTAPPYETSASTNSITFEWNTQNAGHSEVRFGTTDSFELGQVFDEDTKTEHSITITGLEPATIYKVQLRSAADQDTSVTSTYITTTRSPEGTTGQILTYFNQSVAHELATFQEAQQNVNFANHFIQMINQAEQTAEFAFYNISGNAGNNVADAIIAAVNRGVDVRVLVSGHTGNTSASYSRMLNNGVTIATSLGGEQMHNKFAVIDADHQDPSRPWVITSSWNTTDDGTNNQYQNMVNIQDVALARAYLREFNQMWGAESGSFNGSNARFSADKDVVNPSIFWIGEEDTYVELYFSPQANTEAQINRALSTAETSIDLGLNLITRRAISNTMLNRFNQGVKVRGVIGQISGQGSDWDYLSNWADVHHLPAGEFGLLHHKYAIIDGEVTSDNSKVITGSHNWSGNANFSNDENTLIIHHPRVANEFFQEFGARYWQAGGEDQFNVSTSYDDYENDVPEQVSLSQNYPNPFNPVTMINYQLPQGSEVRLEVYNIQGQRVATLVNGFQPSGTHNIQFDASRLASGMYLYRLQTGNTVLTRKMMLIK